jgi:hypothetical protein
VAAARAALHRIAEHILAAALYRAAGERLWNPTAPIAQLA